LMGNPLFPLRAARLVVARGQVSLSLFYLQGASATSSLLMVEPCFSLVAVGSDLPLS